MDAGAIQSTATGGAERSSRGAELWSKNIWAK